MSADILIGTDLTALEQAIRNELAKFFDFKNVSLKILCLTRTTLLLMKTAILCL